MIKFGIALLLSFSQPFPDEALPVGEGTVLKPNGAVYSQLDLDTLARNIYFEERTALYNDLITDVEAAQIGYVVLNRVALRTYPNSIYEVVYQPSQFSWTHDGKPDTMVVEKVRTRAYNIARGVLEGSIPNLVNDADHYLNKDVSKSKWWVGMKPRGKFGGHWFYKSRRK